MKKILVTGCAGFIGYNLTKFLIEKKFFVIGIDNLDNYYSVKLKKQRLDHLRKYKSFKIKQRQKVKVLPDVNIFVGGDLWQDTRQCENRVKGI